MHALAAGEQCSALTRMHTCTHAQTHTGTPYYQKITSGTCASAGLKPITNMDECNAAVSVYTSYNAGQIKAQVSTMRPRPEGYYDATSVGDDNIQNKYWLATNQANVGNGADSSRHHICKGERSDIRMHTCTLNCIIS